MAAKEDPKKTKSEKVTVHTGKTSAKHHGHSHKKVFDITRPGKAPAAATSRPVLVDHKAPVADDQFVPVKTAPPLLAANPAEKHNLMDGRHRKALMPLAAESETAPVLKVIPSGADAAVPAHSQTADSKVPQKSADAESTGTSPTPGKEASATEDPGWELDDDEAAAARLVMEQVVDADDGIASHHLHGGLPDDDLAQKTSSGGRVDAPGPSSVIAESSRQTGPEESAAKSFSQDNATHAKTIDELLAETGAPNLDNHEPGLIVSQHKTGSSLTKLLIVFFAILALAAIAFNLLLDAGYIDMSFGVPHTDFL
jgi:hypothetical protein